MPAEVVHAPLSEHDIDELADALHHEAVYRYIGGLPSRAGFELWLRRAMAGPPPDRARGERWLSFTARRAGTGEVVGRLEATVHDQLAEVAFLYRPDVWGQGLASQGLAWLHGELRRHADILSFWGTTHPDNRRSAALLLRHGYLPAEPSALPVLHSYDAGDLVFTRSVS